MLVFVLSAEFLVRWCGKAAGMLAPFKGLPCRMAGIRRNDEYNDFINKL